MSRVVIAETIRRHLISPGYWLLVATITVIAAFTGGYFGPPKIWLGFVTLLALVVGSRLIGPEFSSGTLQLILSKPVNRSAYLLSRFAGVTAAVWLAVAISFAADAIGRGLVATTPHPDWPGLAAATVNALMTVMLVCALLAFLGSFTRSYNNVAIYILLEIAFGLVIGSLELLMRDRTSRISLTLQAHPWILKSLSSINQNLYPNAPTGFDMRFTAMVLSNACLALLLGCFIFRRREVPYGAD